MRSILRSINLSLAARSSAPALRRDSTLKKLTHFARAECLEGRVLLSTYSFSEVENTGPGQFYIASLPAINNSGVIAVASSHGLYAIGGTTITTIADGTVYADLLDPSINSAGVVADTSRNGPNGYEYIIAGSGGPLTDIGDTSNPTFNNFASRGMGPLAIIDDSGDVVFSDFESVFGVSDWVGNGTSVTAVPSSQDVEAEVGPFVSINDSGVVAYISDPLNQGLDINTWDGSKTTVVYSGFQGGQLGDPGPPAINDEGVLVSNMSGLPDGLPAGIYEFGSDGSGPVFVTPAVGAYSFNDCRTVAYVSSLTFDPTLGTNVPTSIDTDTLGSAPSR